MAKAKNLLTTWYENRAEADYLKYRELNKALQIISILFIVISRDSRQLLSNTLL